MTVDLTDERYTGMLKVDGFDDCVIGIASRCSQVDLLAYSTEKIIAKLIRQGMDAESAWDYFGFNIEGAWHGEATPCFVSNFEEEEG